MITTIVRLIQEYVESFDEPVVWIEYGYLDWD